MKLLLLVSIHFQVTILEEEREGGGGLGPHGPSPGSATGGYVELSQYNLGGGKSS